MANRSIAVHTTEENIRNLDEWAKRLRRSRNSLINEAIEILLEIQQRDDLAKAIITIDSKKAGKR